MSCPTAKRIERELGTTAQVAVQVHSLMNGSTDPKTYSTVKSWIHQCYHMPDRADLIMRAIDAALGTCGTEVVRGVWWDHYYGDIISVYCNTGHSYVKTVFFFYKSQTFGLASQ